MADEDHQPFKREVRTVCSNSGREEGSGARLDLWGLASGTESHPRKVPQPEQPWQPS